MGRLTRKLEKIMLSDEQFGEMVKFIERQTDVLAFYLYGSYGTNLQTVMSDVDLALLPMPDKKLDFERELQLSSELVHIGCNDDINVINLAGVPVTLQMNVIDGGKLLYSREDGLLADFIERVILRYCDFEPDLRTLYRDYDIGLREEFLCR